MFLPAWFNRFGIHSKTYKYVEYFCQCKFKKKKNLPFFLTKNSPHTSQILYLSMEHAATSL